MKRALYALAGSVLFPAALSAAPQMLWETQKSTEARETLIWQQRFLVENNIDYETGFYEVMNAPVYTNKIVLRQSGTNCNLFAKGVEYYSDLRSFPERGVWTGRGPYYMLPKGQISAINLQFRHQGATTSCIISAFAVDAHDDDHDNDQSDYWQTISTFDTADSQGRSITRFGPVDVPTLITGFRVVFDKRFGRCEGASLVDAALRDQNGWKSVTANEFRFDNGARQDVYSYRLGISDLEKIAFRVRSSAVECRGQLQVRPY